MEKIFWNLEKREKLFRSKGNEIILWEWGPAPSAEGSKVFLLTGWFDLVDLFDLVLVRCAHWSALNRIFEPDVSPGSAENGETKLHG